MKLQILIPYYKEPAELIGRLLDSIALQRDADFGEVGVIIAADGTELEEYTLLRGRPYDVHYTAEPHRGIPGTRNRLLELADAEYVMFCDADDMFASVFGLKFIFGAMEEGGFDAFISAFTEEGPEGAKRRYLTHTDDISLCHGKVYRRQYLVDEGIRFDESVPVHEDSLFNGLAARCAKELRQCDMPFYLWCWNPHSTTRREPDFLQRTIADFLRGQSILVRELLRRGKREAAECEVLGRFYWAYYEFMTPFWTEAQRAAGIGAMREYWREFCPLFDMASEERHAEFMEKERVKWRSKGCVWESRTVEEFLNELEGRPA